MENLKIRVNNEAESKEAQELFFELGYQWAYKNIGKNIFYKKENIFLYADKGGNLGTGTKENKTHFNGWFGTFVSLQKLRDLVVLKRNSIDDATHESDREDCDDLYFKCSNGDLYRWFCGSHWARAASYKGILKPIEKPMKEYLRKNNDGEYILEVADEREAQEPHAKHWIEVPKGCDYLISVFGVNSFIDSDMFAKFKTENVLWSRKPMREYLDPENGYKLNLTDRPFFDWIEIPEGCNIITCENRKGNLVYFHWKSLDSDEFFLKDEKIWSNNFNETLSDFIEKNEGDVVIIWSRHTLPEELPFIDDDFKLNIPEELKGRADLLSGRIIIDDEQKYDPNDIDLATGYDLDAIARTHGYRNRDVQESCLCYRESLKIFIERNPSLNDQYAEIEKVRQSAWQKQEGGSHYKNLKIQPMQYALENKLDYAQANVVKYVTRHKEKNGKEDLLKAIHNIELMIEFYYGDEK